MEQWKLIRIVREPFYNIIYKNNKSLNYIEKAGFFFSKFDGVINWDEHSNILCTPINFLSYPKDKTKRSCVLIATGAMSPLHEGHIDMIKAASKAASENGYEVLGSYLSPGHDEYIKEKTGDQWISIHDRLKYASNLIKDEKNIALDPWEGVFAPGAVNFTSVVHRLSLYLKKHFKYNVDILFVCGSDNQRFSLVFKDKPGFGTVIVTRPGHMTIDPEFICSNTIVAECNNPMSSSQIRKEGFKKVFYPKQVNVRITKKKDILAHDIISNYFTFTQLHLVDEQILQFIDVKKNKQILNLDTETNQYNGISLDISRKYDLFGQKFISYTHRPETKFTIDEQISNLKEKEYYLFDDDICSGRTMKFVENKLKENNIKVVGKLSFITSNRFTEVLDAKDFILSNENGLVTMYKGSLIRVPYMYPFVCPATRASITKPMDFSIDMWKMNYKMFKEQTIESEKMLWLTNLGFTPETKIKDVCKYYINLLTHIKKYY